MILKIKADVQLLEAYNIFIDDEKVIKVRGNKTTTLKVSDNEHSFQLQSMNGKSELIKIPKPKEKDTVVVLSFTTNWFKTMKEGYFQQNEME